METLKDKNNAIIDEVCNYVQIERPILTSDLLTEGIKEICVARLCKVVGIKCKYNYKSEFFEFFSNITGEAVCQNLGLKIHVAEDVFRFFKYEKVNLVEKVKELLNNTDKEEAFLDVFEFLDESRFLIKK